MTQSDHLQLIKFWPSCVPGKGVCGGAKIYGSALLQPARSICVSLSAFYCTCCACAVLPSGVINNNNNKFVRSRWPYDMRPSVCHCNSLGGATWRSITGRTDRQTDRQSATQYAAPSYGGRPHNNHNSRSYYDRGRQHMLLQHIGRKWARYNVVFSFASSRRQ